MELSDLSLEGFELVERIQIQRDALNDGGTVFGGWILSHSDYAASILAEKRVRGYVATACLQEFSFHTPGLLSDIFDFYVRIVKEGHTSLHIQLEITAVRYFGQSKAMSLHIASGTFVFVHIGDSGKPSPLP